MLAVNAGYYEFASLGEITEEHFDKIFNTNVRGLLFTVQKALPLLTERSSVILGIGNRAQSPRFSSAFDPSAKQDFAENGPRSSPSARPRRGAVIPSQPRIKNRTESPA